MKFLISNYSSDTQSECMYFNTALNLINSCRSTIWNEASVSAYDIFDLVKPDFYLTHVSNIDASAYEYIKSTNNNIELIINITGIKQPNLNALEQRMIADNVKCAFFFHNGGDNDLISKDNKIVNIGYGADIFLGNNAMKYKIENAIFVGGESEIKYYGDTCHTISTNRKIKDFVDIYLPITKLSNLYDKYENCIIRYFGNLVPQLFYDSVYYGNKVYYDLDSEDMRNHASQKISKLLRLDIDITDKLSIDTKAIRTAVQNRHTCLHRVKSLLSQLPCKDSITNIENIIEHYIKKD